ncbi:MAG TPA: sugar transferase [Candidatus Acidoferrum sp.]|jgi:lipopolysaccharide/colanic/teichoic acid biosynthesis glycosyltransferase|nr:sugar transferase [Candidatus Acidoferrum sp.]
MRRELQLFAKRILDVMLAIFTLIFVAPLLLASAAAIKLGSPGPVFFRLRVAGLGGEGFDQWKLRTMVNGAREGGDRFETSSSDPRITRVGHFLRRWSIDELPQLWNVLRGEMSIVGPRPAFFEVASKYSAEQARRLAMRPGLTGLAQVQGRNLLTWAKRVELDTFYVEHYSLWLDCEIMARTIPVLFRSKGVYGKDGRVRVQDLG